MEDTPQDNSTKKTENGKLYWHRSILTKWPLNDKYRTSTEKGRLRGLSSVKENGIEEEFSIDENGVVYDGCHRLDFVNDLVEGGVSVADNGISLEWIPVKVYPVPQTEEEAIKIAAKGNGDTGFSYWNRSAVMQEKDKFRDVQKDLVFEYEEPTTFDDEFDFSDDNIDEEEENEETETTPTVATDTVTEQQDTPRVKVVKKEITCPNCSHTFTVQ